MNILGIDIGTTSICMVLYDPKKRKIVEMQSVQNAFLSAGNFLQDADEIVKKVEEMLKKWESFSFDAVGISSQMHGIVYVSDSGRAVSPLYTWKNPWGNCTFKNGESFARYLTGRTGYPLYTGYGTVTHFYLQTTGDISGDAVRFVDIGDYLAMRLTGAKNPVVNPSVGASFGGFNNSLGNFDMEVIEKAGVNIGFYPRICTWTEVVGHYHGKKVFTALGDHQASFLAAVEDRKRSIGVNVGTGAQVSVYASDLLDEADFFDRKTGSSIDIRPFPREGYLYTGASLNGGKVYERLALFFQEVCRQFTGITPDIYEKMEQIAAEQKKTSLIACPNLYGAREGKKAGENSGFFGLTEENFHPGDLIRSYVHAMAVELFQLYEIFPEKVKKEKTQIVSSGNGLGKNALLCEEVESVFGRPLRFSPFEEEAAAGAAIFAWENL